MPRLEDAQASSQYLGKFYFDAYWRKWEEVLDCSVVNGLSQWKVKGVGEASIRTHQTAMNARMFFDAPSIAANGRHLRPQ